MWAICVIAFLRKVYKHFPFVVPDGTLATAFTFLGYDYSYKGIYLQTNQHHFKKSHRIVDSDFDNTDGCQ